ncbi:MAG: lantibiotic dehydratase C-terminal domain-containing protein [Gaiellaceae bacterium]
MNLAPASPMDEGLLVTLVDSLVHAELGEEIATWFFFWEPELRLRIRWRDPERVPEHRRTLAALLDGRKADGDIDDWYEGAHGRRGENYVGEADHYGEEIWPRIQEDWMNSSELALTLIKLDLADRLTKPRGHHWQRHVHLFTNQLFGSWEAEIELCLRQALGYSKLRQSPPTPEAKKLIAELHEFLRDD